MLLGSQHSLLVLFGVVLVPAMITQLHELPLEEANHILFATILSAGGATLLQVLRYGSFGLGMPLFMGTAGAYLACSHAAVAMGGVSLLVVMSVLTAPIFAMYGFFLRYLRRIITPTVGGVVIMLAVAGLLKDATITWTGDMDLAWIDAAPRLIVGVVTICAMMAVSWLGGDSLRPWSLLVGLGVGVAAAWLGGILDVSLLREAAIIGGPPRHIEFALLDFELAHAVLWLTFAMAAVVTCVSYTGNAMAIQEIAGHSRGMEDYEAIQGGLYSCSVSTLAAGLLGGMPLAPNSPNLSLLKMTGVTARRVGVAGALFLVVISFFPKFHAAVLSVPGPVLGAIGVYLVAQLFATGMAMVASEGLCFRNGQIAGLSIILGIMVESELFFPNAFPEFLEPLYTNGFAIAGLTAIALSTLHNVILERWDTFSVNPSMEELPVVQSHIESLSKKYGLGPLSAGYLGLACEEALQHVLNASEMEEGDKTVTFRLKSASEHIKVEISLSARAESVAQAQQFEPHQADEEELRKLGLFLLSKVAHNFGQIYISGHTFISFEVAAE